MSKSWWIGVCSFFWTGNFWQNESSSGVELKASSNQSPFSPDTLMIKEMVGLTTAASFACATKHIDRVYHGKPHGNLCQVCLPKKTDEDKHGILQKLHINSNKHNIPDQLTKTHPKRTIFGGWKNLSLPSAWIKMFWSFLHGFLQRHEGLLFVKISPGVTYTTWKVDGATPMYTPEN